MIYLVLTILAFVFATTAAEIGLVDGFFCKPPAIEELDVLRNSELLPHRIRNVGRDRPSRPKRMVADNQYWDSPDSLASKWFSTDDKDFCRVAKAVIIVFTVIGFAGLLILILCICRKYFTDHAYGYSEMDCRSSGCKCGQEYV